MLVVLAILGIVLAAIAQLFTSAMRPRADQTNRTEAQQHARLGLDKLRREIRCASAVTTPSGYPASAITVTLGSYCQATGGATTVTWCTKDRNGATPPVAGAQPYTLWRYVGAPVRAPGRPGRRTSWTSSRSVTAGRIFDASFTPAATLTAASGGTLALGNLLVRRHGGARRAASRFRRRSHPSPLRVTVNRSPPQLTGTGATSYNVYGGDGEVCACSRTVAAGTSFVDYRAGRRSPAR